MALDYVCFLCDVVCMHPMEVFLDRFSMLFALWARQFYKVDPKYGEFRFKKKEVYRLEREGVSSIHVPIERNGQ